MKNRLCKNVFKIISIVYVSLFLFGLLTGCHRKSDAAKSDITTQMSSSQTLTNEEPNVKADVDYVGQYLDEDNNEPNLYIVSLPDGS